VKTALSSAVSGHAVSKSTIQSILCQQLYPKSEPGGGEVDLLPMFGILLNWQTTRALHRLYENQCKRSVNPKAVFSEKDFAEKNKLITEKDRQLETRIEIRVGVLVLGALACVCGSHACDSERSFEETRAQGAYTGADSSGLPPENLRSVRGEIDSNHEARVSKH